MDIKELSSCIEKIKTEIMPQWNKLKGAMEIDIIENFSNQIKELAINHNCYLLEDYAIKLNESADLFDIASIEKSLDYFPDLFDQLTKQFNSIKKRS